jgi:uncharacterized protein (TIGR00369 family)
MTGSLDAAGLVALMPFAGLLGVALDAASAQEVRGHLDWDAAKCTAGGVLHGGVLMSLADSVGAVCAFLNLPAGATTSTIESKTNFFRGVRAGRLHAVSRPLHVGRSTIAVQTDLYDDERRRVGMTTQTQAVLS